MPTIEIKTSILAIDPTNEEDQETGSEKEQDVVESKRKLSYVSTQRIFSYYIFFHSTS